MAGPFKEQQRLFQQRDHHLGSGQRLGRPQIQDPVGAVEKVLARPVQLFENVEEENALLRAKAVETVRRLGMNPAVFDIDGCNALVAVGPVVGPVAVDPYIIVEHPAARAVPCVEKPSSSRP